MRRLKLLMLVLLCSFNAYSQYSGEKNFGSFFYAHKIGQTDIKSIQNFTVKWNFSTLFGEPVINGSFKWDAGIGTPSDFLDYRDAVILQLEVIYKRRINFKGRNLCIKISPLVPRAGEGYGFNVAGSPNWKDVFCDFNGNNLELSAQDAKDIWRWGFKVLSAHLVREGGLDEENPYSKKSDTADDFWNTPENTTTARDVKIQEGHEKAKQAKEEANNKYNALKKPFTKAFKKGDTIYGINVKPLEKIDAYFGDADVTITAKNLKTGVSNSVNSANSELPLTEGWNMVRYVVKSGQVTLKDSVKVYYSAEIRSLFAYYDKAAKKYGFKDAKGNVIISPQFFGANDFSEGLGAVRDISNKWGFINYKGDFVINCKYTEVSKFSEGLVLVKEEYRDNWKFINRNNEVVIIVDKKYEQINDFKNGKALVRWDIYKTAQSESQERSLRSEGYVDKPRGLVLTARSYGSKSTGDSEEKKTYRYSEKDLVKHLTGYLNKSGVLIESH